VRLGATVAALAVAAAVAAAQPPEAESGSGRVRLARSPAVETAGYNGTSTHSCRLVSATRPRPRLYPACAGSGSSPRRRTSCLSSRDFSRRDSAFSIAAPNHGTASSAGSPHVGLVPWRDPAGDMAAFFPGATGYRAETHILSHLRLSLAQQLGHPPMGDDLLLRSYRVLRGSRRVGAILVRRVKGEYGAIELVLAVTPAARVRGVRLQRQREPAPIAAALQGPAWRAAFAGKTADSRWRVGEDLPPVPPEARPSAQAIADGARTALILFRAADSGSR